jgi:hypothetical protein
LEGGPMQARHEAIATVGPVDRWRVTQLTRRGIPGPPAQAEADQVDWHQVTRLFQRGCAPALAARIVR